MFKLIFKNWPDAKGVSPSTISRAVAALEEAGVLRQEGSTKGRKIHLLPKAGNWQRLTGSKKECQDTGEFQQNSNQTPSMTNSLDQMLMIPVSTAEDYPESTKETNVRSVNTMDGNDFINEVKKSG